MTLKSTANTGLFKDDVFYAGHLLGETTGADNGVYTVSNADRAPIRAAIGETVGIDSILDINKDGEITFADLGAVGQNIGIQQANITTAANPLADLTRSQSWNLDALGNFQSLTKNDGSPESRTHNLQNQVTQVGSVMLSFDPNGNMTGDEQGRTFVWDAWNRLVRVQDASEQTLVEYQYDGLKRRIVEQPAGQSSRVLYYSDQWQVIEERVGGDTQVQYVWSPVYVDAMILRDRDADGNSGNGLEERIYVMHDANFNVTAITDATGEVLERYYYEAYGRAVYLDANFELLAGAQSQQAWRHLHQGGRLDFITGNYHFRHRDLSPTLGRWISQDPIGFEAGDANLYRYVGNGPTVRLDHLGLWWWDGDWIELGVGGLLGFQGDEVQAEAGFNIVNNPLFGLPGLISVVDPTPLSGSVDAILTGVWEGNSIGEIAVNVGLEFFPGPRPGRHVPGGPRVGIGGGGGGITPPIKPGTMGGPTSGGKFPKKVKDQAHAENPNGVCVYCGTPGAGRDVDHAIPRSRGGDATLDNAQITCPHCNRSKGNSDFPRTPPDGYVGNWPPDHW